MVKEWPINPIKEWQVIPRIFMPLVHDYNHQIINYCILHGKQLNKIGGGGCFSPSVDHITHHPPQE